MLNVANVDPRSLAIVERDGDGFVALASFRVGAASQCESSSLRLKILLDCSGSMNGDSIDAARRALQRVLASFAPDDYFSLSRFGSRVEHKTMGLVAAGERIVGEVARAVADAKADLGGTEMQRALEAVFAIDAEGRPADVLLITDGEIWAADATIALARTERQRVFVVGVGSAPAQSVLPRLAEATGGSCAFVAPAENPQDAIVRMVERLRAPRAACVDLAWPGTPDWCTTPPTGVFAGETVHAFAGFSSEPKGDASLQAHAESGEAVSHACVALPAPSPGTVLARIGAAMRLASLDDEQARLDLALRHSLLTERTNLLVVHERAEAERADDLPQLSTVPQMHAAGWGGIGTVRAPMLSLDFDYSSYVPSHRPGLAVVRCARRATRAPATLDTIDALLRALDQRIAWLPLPATLDDLENMGLAAETLDALRAVADLGRDERMIVEAFLIAIAARVRRFGPGRQFVRAMRSHHRPSPVTPDVRAEVDAIVANLRRRTFGERFFEGSPSG
ncbi:MAG TPA: VWA domain-containing protein [Casimicrobiaceae bacterium]